MVVYTHKGVTLEEGDVTGLNSPVNSVTEQAKKIVTDLWRSLQRDRERPHREAKGRRMRRARHTGMPGVGRRQLLN